ncbi:MAG: gamma-glutamylcyclotransferase [Blautia sp.]|nr:gamma-glutamylcyclotransferase [Blautia sp.]
MRTLYLAYGSNLSVKQMALRCPDAEIVGKAIIPDWRLVFKLHADIIPEKGSYVPVLVWSISDKDEAALDRYEGFPRYYVKKDFDVTMTDLEGNNPKAVTAMAYIMTEGHFLREPDLFYYMVLQDGYEAFGFDMTLLRKALQEAVYDGIS